MKKHEKPTDIDDTYQHIQNALVSSALPGDIFIWRASSAPGAASITELVLSVNTIEVDPDRSRQGPRIAITSIDEEGRIMTTDWFSKRTRVNEIIRRTASPAEPE